MFGQIVCRRLNPCVPHLSSSDPLFALTTWCVAIVRLCRPSIWTSEDNNAGSSIPCIYNNSPALWAEREIIFLSKIFLVSCAVATLWDENLFMSPFIFILWELHKPSKKQICFTWRCRGRQAVAKESSSTHNSSRARPPKIQDRDRQKHENIWK